MATILWTTAQYSDRPVELSATQLVITQAKCAGGDSSARALRQKLVALDGARSNWKINTKDVTGLVCGDTL